MSARILTDAAPEERANLRFEMVRYVLDHGIAGHFYLSGPEVFR
jgi:hypothetical protein